MTQSSEDPILVALHEQSVAQRALADPESRTRMGLTEPEARWVSGPRGTFGVHRTSQRLRVAVAGSSPEQQEQRVSSALEHLVKLLGTPVPQACRQALLRAGLPAPLEFFAAH